MWIIFLLIILIISIPLVLFAGKGRKWSGFYVKGAEAGFSMSEMKFLRKAAEQGDLDNPASIYFSIDQLDHSISMLSNTVEQQGLTESVEECELLEKLYEYRKKIEFNKPRYKYGIKHTIELKIGQRIKIALGKGGLFRSEILEIDDTFLTISYPTGNTLPKGTTWRGKKLRVYFQKNNDASYFFESSVKDDYFDRTFKLLHISHSSSILRSQRRTSIRTKANFPVTIFPLKDMNQVDNLIQTDGGFRGEMQDLSEDGASLVIGGKGKDGLLVKLQFQLGRNVIVVCGVVKYFDYTSEDDRSVLHLQFMKPDDESRNKILSFVYNVHRKKQSFQEPDSEFIDQVNDEYHDDEIDEAELIEMIEEIDEE